MTIVAWVVGEISVGPSLGIDYVGQMWLRIQNKQTISDFYNGKCTYRTQKPPVLVKCNGKLHNNNFQSHVADK